MRVDLHMHSYYSDGTMSPREILEMAKEKNISVLALTDHDVLEGSKELLEISGDTGVQCIAGVEINGIEDGRNFHILGYGIDLYDKTFNDFVCKNREMLEEVNIKLIEKVEKDYEEVTLEDYNAYTYDRRLGGWKGLHYLVDKGLTQTPTEGFRFYRNYDHAYTCVDFPTIQEVCEAIHKAGGKAVLAHPGKSIRADGIEQFKEQLAKMMDRGIDGIECYYPLHSNEVTEICLEMCKDKDLLITCGSDCHGTFLDAEMGTMAIGLNEVRLGNLVK